MKENMSTKENNGLWKTAEHRPEKTGYVLAYNCETGVLTYGYYIHSDDWFFTIENGANCPISFDEVSCTHYIFINDILPPYPVQ